MMRSLAAGAAVAWVAACEPMPAKLPVPLELECTAGEPLAPIPPLSRPGEPAQTGGQQTADAVEAKRLFDSERWLEATIALRHVADGATGDDDGTRQIAQYHLGIALFRQKEMRASLDIFAGMAANEAHVKWQETLLWIAKFLMDPDWAGKALPSLAGYGRDHIARFDNPQQQDLYWLLMHAHGLVALSRKDYVEAATSFSAVGKRADQFGAAQDCLEQIRALGG